MKILIAIVGLFIGAFLGGAVLMLNPVTLVQAEPAGLSGAIRTLSWRAGGGFRGFELTPAGLIGASGSTGEKTAFKDPGIRFARAEIVVLADEAGTGQALGVKLSSIARTNSLVQARLGVATAWNVIWPGRGSMMLAGSENFWTPLRDGLWSAARGRGFRPGRARYPLPPIPGLGPPLLIGGTGEFAEAKGRFREEFSPSADDPAEFTGSRQLHIAVE